MMLSTSVDDANPRTTCFTSRHEKSLNENFDDALSQRKLKVWWMLDALAKGDLPFLELIPPNQSFQC
jgi:hypothetical protein